MAVHAHTRHLPHGFRALGTGTTLLLDEHPGCVPTAPAGIADTRLLSDLTCSHGFVMRKRARLAAASGFLPEDQRTALIPAAMQGPVPVPPIVDVQSRAVGSGAASTSGKTAANSASSTVSRGLLSWPCHRDLEIDIDIDAVITSESERMRLALEEARRRHARALLAAVGRAAAGRFRAAEAELERALRHNAELEDKARQMAAECQAWMGVARSHEAVAAGLRATLDQLVQSPWAVAAGEGEAEDAQSCCFEAPAADANDGASTSKTAGARSCRSCGGGEACVLLLPCRHLCLCRACEAAACACPVCAAAKNGALHVLAS